MTAYRAILAKDLRTELRTLQSLPAMAIFAVTAFVIFRFGLDRTSLSGSLAAGVLWTTLLFAAVLGVNRLFVAERAEGGFDAIRLAPIDRTVLFAAKASALLVYLLALELIAVPVFALFFLDSAAGLGPLVAVLALADLGLAGDRHADLLDGGQLEGARPARAARPPAPCRAADDRRDRRHRPLARQRWPRLPPLRDLACRPRPIRFDLPPGRIRGLRLPPGGLSSSSWRTELFGSAPRERMYGKGLRTLSIATAAAIAVAFSLVFFYAPLDADQGFIQKIFYLHVPLAIVALVGFVVGGVFAILHLRSGDRRWDAYSYVSIHMSVIFGVAVLITGAIWAKASWGHWWVWEEPTLVSFLIVFLMYATYYPFRYAIEDPERQARYASVFAITAGAFVPLNFIAVRMAQSLVHPRVFATANGGLPGSMMLTFLVSLAAIALLWVTMVKFELTAKSASGQLKRLRRALDAPPAGDSPRIAPEVG